MAVVIDNLNGAIRPRHPEKQGNPETPLLRKPEWLRVRAPGSAGYNATRDIVKAHGLVTVCEEAACPNIGECWSKSHATMMIMGEICTRACAFCNVSTGKPGPLDPTEPARVADAVAKMGLKHVVITSVDRDDLSDGGAAHFAAVVHAIRAAAPDATVEILTPDFARKPVQAIFEVIDARPDVFNHNLETVPRLYLSIRPGARYYHSLRLLERVKERDPEQFTKSGVMVGLGESKEEVMQVMDDMRSAGVDFITIGQYLQPTRRHAPIDRFVHPDEFRAYEEIARAKGFLMVAASPLTRSSHHAGEDFARLQAARQAKEFGGLRHHVTKVLPYAPDQLFALVGDVGAYPQFVPWITAMRTWNARRTDEGIETVDAEAAVGFSFLKERFSTRVTRDPNARRIDVALLAGPFRRLANRWEFHDDPAGTRVEFDIDFQFKARLLDGLLAANFHHAVERLMGCFETRAAALYDPRSSGSNSEVA